MKNTNFGLISAFIIDTIAQYLTRVLFGFTRVKKSFHGYKRSNSRFYWEDLITGHTHLTYKCYEKLKFTEVFMSFPWEKYDFSIFDAPLHMTTEFLYNMSLFLEMEPKTPIKSTCHPKNLLSYQDTKCENYPDGLTGIKRNKTVKVAHMINFGFDVDILEIHLNELYTIVDKIFIIEQTVTHFKSLPKPLMWERIKYQKRFIKFKDKVVHLIMDDKEMVKSLDGGVWGNEAFQEQKRWEYFLEWNSKTNYFSDDDVIGFGHSDEIASMHSINLLKNCEIMGPIDIGIWFTHGAIHTKFKSDYPVKGHPFTFGSPTFYSIKDAKKTKPCPSHRPGKSGRFLLGGIHLSRYHYLPYAIIKTICATETNTKEIQEYVKEIFNMLKNGDDANTIQYHKKKKIIEIFRSKLERLNYDLINKNEYMLPWFLECNLQRFPTFLEDTIPDGRLL